MKMLLFLLIFTSTAQAANIVSAKMDMLQENILVEVICGGGCRNHTFSLKLDPYCKESYPVQCSALLVQTTEGGLDACRGMVKTTAVFNLKEYGLDDTYYSGASLTIRGKRSLTGDETSATVDLPWQN
jgi:hypothetical protein